MNATYDAASIEVLAGLDPVRKRPGMYTDTARPNHLAQEVVDNSVDEAIVGQAARLSVVLHADDSLTVVDDGRGMPVDIHPEEGIPGVELILTRLHAGGKFTPGKLPVLRRAARSRRVRGQRAVAAARSPCEARRQRARDGVRGRREDARSRSDRLRSGAGTRERRSASGPIGRYFDSPKFSLPRLRHALRAKAVLCPGLRVSFEDEATGERNESGTTRTA